MAGYNEILVGRYNRALQKLLSMKGRKSLESLNPEIHVVINTFYGAENRYLEGWNRYGKGIGIGAQGAGNTSNFRIRNPAGSNVVAVVEAVEVSTTGAASQFFLALQAATVDQTSVSNPFRLDPRWGQAAISSLTWSVGFVAPLGNTIRSVAVLANTVYNFINAENQEIPILPGDAFEVQLGNLNQSFQGSVMIRERFLEDSERT